jgi:hypothetical protein
MTKVTGWKLDRGERDELLARFPTRYADRDADHVTLASGQADDADPPPPPRSAEIIGVADDGLGVQAMVVRLDGTTDRPDGSTYHITWSLDRAAGRKPVESNAVIAEHGWTNTDQPVPITLTPALWP